MKTVTVAEPPDLTEPAWELTQDAFPEYNNHGDVLNVYWSRLVEERPDFQFHLIGDDDAILARARSIPGALGRDGRGSARRRRRGRSARLPRCRRLRFG